MIDEIEIRNFRCFEHIKILNCKRFNVIVGDNGVGKTALLEAMFLTLSGNVEVSLRLKAQRGFDTAFSGPPRAIEEAIWRDYFYNLDWHRNISVDLRGSGTAARAMTISRGPADVLIPFSGQDQANGNVLAPLIFNWRDAQGNMHPAVPQITAKGIQFGVVEEDVPDFFLFAANQIAPASENAARFSALSQENREDAFVKVFTREYPWITGLNIEVSGGFPIIHASIQGGKKKLPLNAISGGINRSIAIMLALASRPKSIVIVDEIEAGIFYKHKTALWRGLLSLARDHGSQMFLTTHDEEWLEALVEASEDNIDDIALWRLERTPSGPIMRQFAGEAFKAAEKFGGELR